MSEKISILEGYAPEEDFAAANHINPRTVARYRNQPDGLPYVKWAGRVYIHVLGARDWLAKRTIRRNQRRGA
jgi:hypothetical protein